MMYQHGCSYVPICDLTVHFTYNKNCLAKCQLVNELSHFGHFRTQIAAVCSGQRTDHVSGSQLLSQICSYLVLRLSLLSVGLSAAGFLSVYSALVVNAALVGIFRLFSLMTVPFLCQSLVRCRSAD